MPATSQAQNKQSDQWDKVIAEARSKIEGLKTSIAVFEDRKKAGDPCPFTSDNDKKAASHV